jgi:hypothetical protein
MAEASSNRRSSCHALVRERSTITSEPLRYDPAFQDRPMPFVIQVAVATKCGVSTRSLLYVGPDRTLVRTIEEAKVFPTKQEASIEGAQWGGRRIVEV